MRSLTVSATLRKLQISMSYPKKEFYTKLSRPNVERRMSTVFSLIFYSILLLQILLPTSNLALLHQQLNTSNLATATQPLRELLFIDQLIQSAVMQSNQVKNNNNNNNINNNNNNNNKTSTSGPIEAASNGTQLGSESMQHQRRTSATNATAANDGTRERISSHTTNQQINANLIRATVASQQQQQQKLPTSNLSTHIPGPATNSLSQVRHKWRLMERSMGLKFNSYALELRQLLVESSAGTGVSSECLSSLSQLIDGLAEQKLWSTQVVDSSAHLPSGLLEGTLTELGNFDQCLSISTTDQWNTSNGTQQQQQQQVLAQYCSILIKPRLMQRPRLHTVCQRMPALSAAGNQTSWRLLSQQSHQFYYVGLRLGLCAPNKCSRADLQLLLSAYLAKFELVGQVKSCQQQQVVANNNNEANLPDQPGAFVAFDLVQQCILSTFFVLLLLVFVATLLDHRANKRSPIPHNHLTLGSSGGHAPATGELKQQAKHEQEQKHRKPKRKFCDDTRTDQQLQANYRNPKLKPTKQMTTTTTTTTTATTTTSSTSMNTTGCKGGANLGATTAAAAHAACAAKRWQYQVYRPSSCESNLEELRANRLLLLAANSAHGSSLSPAPSMSPQRNPIADKHIEIDHQRLAGANLIGCKEQHLFDTNLPEGLLSPPELSFLCSHELEAENYWSSSPAKDTLIEHDNDHDHDHKTILPMVSRAGAGSNVAHKKEDPNGQLVKMMMSPPPITKRNAKKLDQHATGNPQPPAKKSLAPSDKSWRETLLSLIVCFSLKRNLKVIGKYASKEKETTQMGDIKVIHGLRTFTMIWIIFGHTIGLVSPEMMNNLFSLAQLSCSSRFLQALLNATLAVNTFFMISGLVTVVSFARRCKSCLPLLFGSGHYKKHHHHHQAPATESNLEEVNSIHSTSSSNVSSSSIVSSSLEVSSSASSKRKCIKKLAKKEEEKKFKIKEKRSSWPNDFKPLSWLIMRYLRLTPAYATIVAACILLPALGSGPFWWELLGVQARDCRANWWTNMFYVNNFIQTDKLCLIHSWYLSNDWQFFMLALVLFGSFYKSKKLTILLMLLLGCASSAATFFITVQNNFPPTIVTTSPALGERWLFIHSLYYKPWPHLTSYLIGLVIGYLIVSRDCSRGRMSSDGCYQGEMSSQLRAFSWCLFALVAVSLLNSIYPWNMGLQVEPLLTGLHSATFRTLWAMCCGWLVYALVTRPQNVIARFLAWHGFQISSRLTYCAYLVHPLIIYYHFGTLRERIDSSVYGQLHRFVGTLGLTYFFALLLSLLVESPSIQLQHLLSEWGRKREEEELSRQGRGTNVAYEEDDSTTTTTTTSGLETKEPRSTRSGSTSSTSSSSNEHSWSASSSFSQQPHRSDLKRYLAASRATRGEFPEFPAILHPKDKNNKTNNNNNNLEPHKSCRLHGKASETNLSSSNPLGSQQMHSTAGNQCPSAEAASSDSSESSMAVALDSDFQRRLAQAISRGFRIRSRLAANSGNSQLSGQDTSNPTTTTSPALQAIARRGQQPKRIPLAEAPAARLALEKQLNPDASQGTNRGGNHFINSHVSDQQNCWNNNNINHQQQQHQLEKRKTNKRTNSTTPLSTFGQTPAVAPLAAAHCSSSNLHSNDLNQNQHQRLSAKLVEPIDLNEMIRMQHKLFSRSQSQTDEQMERKMMMYK